MREIYFKLWLHAFYPKEYYDGTKRRYGKGHRKTVTTKWLEGMFHCFSTSWEELGSGVGQYPIAIVEDKKGHVHEVGLHHLKFKKRREKS
jgi:hypothetical protein